VISQNDQLHDLVFGESEIEQDFQRIRQSTFIEISVGVGRDNAVAVMPDAMSGAKRQLVPDNVVLGPSA
jgi:hypothetical protein